MIKPTIIDRRKEQPKRIMRFQNPTYEPTIIKPKAPVQGVKASIAAHAGNEAPFFLKETINGMTPKDNPLMSSPENDALIIVKKSFLWNPERISFLE